MNHKSTRILTLTLLLMLFAATQAFGQKIYDNIPNPLPGNAKNKVGLALSPSSGADHLLCIATGPARCPFHHQFVADLYPASPRNGMGVDGDVACRPDGKFVHHA